MSAPSPRIGDVGAAVPVDVVVAGTAVERLVPDSTEERVVAFLAVERRLLGVGEDAVGLVDREDSLPSPASTTIASNRRSEVVTDDAILRVDLELVGSPAKPEDDLVVPRCALDDQRPVLDVSLDLGSLALVLGGAANA